MPRFTFDTELLRGRTEREHPVTVTYEVRPGCPDIEIISVTGVDYTTAEEDAQLHDLACDRADDDMAEYAAGYAEYRADMLWDERLLDRRAA